MNSLMIPAWNTGAQESEPESDCNEVNASEGPAAGGPLFFLRGQIDNEPRSSTHTSGAFSSTSTASDPWMWNG